MGGRTKKGVDVKLQDGWIDGIPRIACGEDLGDPAFPETPDTEVNDWYLHPDRDISIGIRRDYGDDPPILIVGTSSRLTAACPSDDDIAWAMACFGFDEFEIVERDNWWAYVRVVDEAAKKASRLRKSAIGVAAAAYGLASLMGFSSERGRGRPIPNPRSRTTVATRETMGPRIKSMRKRAVGNQRE